MKVTIIGLGNMGRGVGTRRVAGEHLRLLGVAVDDLDLVSADELGGSATALGPNDPFGGDIVVLAVYYPGNKDAYASTATGSRGRSSSTSPTQSTPRRGTTSSQRPGRPPPRRWPSSSRRELPS